MLGQTGNFDFNLESNKSQKPLSTLLRPKEINEYIGQNHILGKDKPLRKTIEKGIPHSFIFWGPPGTGKTTLAEIIASSTNTEIERISAVTAGVKDIRASISKAIKYKKEFNKNTYVFIDEIHRFNKSQQDVLLPHIENGDIYLIGATTENVAFELNKALLSRVKVYTLNKLSIYELEELYKKGLKHCKDQEDIHISIDNKTKEQMIAISDGDGRKLLNLLEHCIQIAPREKGFIDVTLELLISIAGDKIALYDKNGDAFYDLLSAFHKSVRGSSPDGAIYWYARVLNASGDPLHIARRLLAIASEDIGNADPKALQIGLNAWDIYHRVGAHEGERAIAQAVVYMALAPKSNSIYKAFNAAKELAIKTSSLDVPKHLKNATSSITKELGHGEEYRYSHNENNAYSPGQAYMPNELLDINLYTPNERGYEKELKTRLEQLTQLDKKYKNNNQ